MRAGRYECPKLTPSQCCRQTLAKVMRYLHVMICYSMLAVSNGQVPLPLLPLLSCLVPRHSSQLFGTVGVIRNTWHSAGFGKAHTCLLSLMTWSLLCKHWQPLSCNYWEVEFQLEEEFQLALLRKFYNNIKVTPVTSLDGN